MRSKTSYFNPTLFKKNLTRFWPLWGGASAIGALIPLYLLAALLEAGFRRLTPDSPLQATLQYYSALVYIVPVISLFYAALCALAVWHYLYNARSVGMFHSLPITRKGLFFTNLLSGMAMMLIPYAVTGGLLVLLSLPIGAFDPAGVAVTILGVLGESLFYFATATVIIFITGNPFAYAAFYFIFHFFAVGAEWLVTELMNQFYFGVEETYQGIAMFLSPTVYLVEKLSVFPTYEETVIDGGWVDYGRLESVSLLNGHIIALYALAGAALLACAWTLYQRRRSESAGEVVAVGWMKPVFRYGVALCAAVSGGAALYLLFVDGLSSPATVRVVPMAVCMIIAGLVGYYIASMLLAKSLRVFKGSARGVLITAGAAAAVCFAIAADPFGVESWVPDAGAVSSVNLRIYGAYGRSLYVDLDDAASIEKAVGLHQAVLAEQKELEKELEERGDWTRIGLIYYTEDGIANRYYSVPNTRKELLGLAAGVATDPDIQEANLFSSIQNDHITEARLTGGYIGDLYSTLTQEYDGADLTLEQAKALEEAVRRDIQAGHFGKTVFVGSYQEYQESTYFGSLQLNYNVTWKPEPGEPSRGTPNGTRTVSFEISVYCTETLKALEDMGILDGTSRLMTEAENERLRNLTDKYREDWENWDAYSYPDTEYVW